MCTYVSKCVHIWLLTLYMVYVHSAYTCGLLQISVGSSAVSCVDMLTPFMHFYASRLFLSKGHLADAKV